MNLNGYYNSCKLLKFEVIIMLTTLKFCCLDSKVRSKTELTALLDDNIKNIWPLFQLKHELCQDHFFPDEQSWSETG